MTVSRQHRGRQPDARALRRLQHRRHQPRRPARVRRDLGLHRQRHRRRRPVLQRRHRHRQHQPRRPNAPATATNPDHYFGDTPPSRSSSSPTAPTTTPARRPDVPPSAAPSPGPTTSPTTGSNVPLTTSPSADNIAGVNPTPVLSGGFNTGDTNHDGLLESGETWVFTASGTAIAGQYSNVGTATGTQRHHGTRSRAPHVTATNPDHYFGDTAAIQIVKLTNGTNNDSPPGRYVPSAARRLDLQRLDTGSVPLDVTVSDQHAGVNPTPVLSGGFNTGDTNPTACLGRRDLGLQPPAAPPSPASTPTSAPPRATPRQHRRQRPAPAPPRHRHQPRPLTSATRRPSDRQAHQRHQQRHRRRAPYVPVGATVTWTYNVTDPGQRCRSATSPVTDNIAGVNPTRPRSSPACYNIGDTNIRRPA